MSAQMTHDESARDHFVLTLKQHVSSPEVGDREAGGNE
jgi:hypothetical protein